MKIRFDESVNPGDFLRLAKELEKESDVKGLMVLACDANDWNAEVLNPICQALGKPVFGGIFPQIIHGRKNYEKGFLVVGLPVAPDIVTVQGLSDPEADYDPSESP